MKKIIIIIMIFGTGFALLNLNPDLRTDPEYSRISSHIVQAWDSKKDAEELAYYNEELLKAARNGDLTTVQTMIANGADINWTSAAGSGETSLIAASRLGHCEIVEYLISQGQMLTWLQITGSLRCLALCPDQALRRVWKLSVYYWKTERLLKKAC